MRPSAAWIPLLCLSLLSTIGVALTTPARAADPDSTQAAFDSLLAKYSTLAASHDSIMAADRTPRRYERASANGALQVCVMPATAVDANGVRHPYCWRDRPLTVWGRASGGTAPYHWTWDFGDGSAAVSGDAYSLAEANYIATAHAYATQGTFTARLTVTDATSSVSASETSIDVAADARQVRIDAAIEDGLRYLYLTQGSDGSWYPYNAGSTGGALAAFQLRGHLLSNDPCGDIYTGTVHAAVDFLLTHAGTTSLTPGSYPDVNGNGRAVYLDPSSYMQGLAMIGLATGRSLDYVSPGGATAGMTVREVLEDAVEQCYVSQAGNGGWRYSILASDGSADNSIVQWVVLGMMAAQDAGVTIDPLVKTRLANWIAYSQASDGGFGYASVWSWNNIAKTASGMISLRFLGAYTDDGRVQAALGFISNHWLDGYDNNGSREHLNGNIYSMYSLAKSCRLMTTGASGPAVTDIGAHDWYSEYVDALVVNGSYRQNSDGSWPDAYWIGTSPLSTALGVLILNPESVTECRPVARATANPATASCPAVAVHFDGAQSSHQCSDKHIVEWLWDFDDADGVDFDTPDAVGPTADNAAGYALAAGQTSHTFQATLRVKDDSPTPLYSTLKIPVTVNNANNPPVACLKPDCATDAYAGRVGESIHFDGRASYDPDACNGDGIASYSWDLNGDGVYGDATGPTADYTWTSTHYGQVGLRVYDTHGVSNSGQVYVAVYASDRNLSISPDAVTFMPPCTDCPYDHVTAKVDVRLELQGVASANIQPFTVQYYDGRPAFGGTLIGEQEVPGGVYSERTFTLEQTMSVPTTAGSTQLLFVKVDSRDQVFEFDETDNVAVKEWSRTTVGFAEDPVATCTSTRLNGVPYWLVGTIHTIRWQVSPDDAFIPTYLILQTSDGTATHEMRYLAESLGGSAAPVKEMPFIVPRLAIPEQGLTGRLVLERDGIRSNASSEFHVVGIREYVEQLVPGAGPGAIAGVVYSGEAGRLRRAAAGEVFMLWAECDPGCLSRLVDYAVQVPIGCDGFFMYRPTVNDPNIDAGHRIQQICLVPNGNDPRNSPVANGAWEIDYLREDAGHKTVVQYVVVDPTRSTKIADPFGCREHARCLIATRSVAGMASVLTEPERGWNESRATPHPLVLLNGWTEHPDSYRAMSINLSSARRAEPFGDEGIHRAPWLVNFHGWETGASDAGLALAYGLEVLLRGLYVGGDPDGMSPASADIVAHSFGAMAVRAYLQERSGRRDASGLFSNGAARYRHDAHKVVLLTPVDHGSHEANRVIAGGITGDVLDDLIAALAKCTSRGDPMPEDMGIGSAFQWAVNGPGGKQLKDAIDPKACLVIASTRMSRNLADLISKWEAPQTDGPVSLCSASLFDQGVPLLTTTLWDHSHAQTTASARVARAIDLFLSQEDDALVPADYRQRLVDVFGDVDAGAWYLSTDGKAGNRPALVLHGGLQLKLPDGTAEKDVKLISRDEVAFQEFSGHALSGWIRADGYRYRIGWTSPTAWGSVFHTWGWESCDKKKNDKVSDCHRVDLSVRVDGKVPGAPCGSVPLDTGAGELRSMATDEDMSLPTGIQAAKVFDVRVRNKTIASLPVERATLRSFDLSGEAVVGVLAASPVVVRVETPDGHYVDATDTDVVGARYEKLYDDDGRYHTFVAVPQTSTGPYRVSIRPAPEARPDDTFSLYVFNAGIAETLATDRQIAEAAGVTMTADIQEPPAAPAGLSVTAGVGRLVARWSVDRGDLPARYRVFYGAPVQADFYDGTQAAEGESPVEVSGETDALVLTCLPDSAFHVTVVAVDSAGRESEYSNEVVATPLRPGGKLKLTPETVNLTSNGQYFSAELTLDPGWTTDHLVISSMRLGGTVPAIVSKADVKSASTVTAKFDRAQVEALFPNGGVQSVAITVPYVGCVDTLTIEARDTVRVIKPHIEKPSKGSALDPDADTAIVWSIPSELAVDSVSVSYSIDNGRTWEMLAHGIVTATQVSWRVPNTNTPSAYVRVDAFSGSYFVGRGTSESFRIGSGSVDVEGTDLVPRQLFLSAPRPTPFQSTATIEYGLPKLTDVRIDIYDVGGRLVRTLVNGLQAPGRKSVSWSGTDDHGAALGSGVYIVRLTAGSEVRSRKATLIR